MSAASAASLYLFYLRGAAFSPHSEMCIRDRYYYNQQGASTLATINASKINDFIRATVMVRINLENIGVYNDFKKGYHALCRKTCLCCFYYVVKMHYRQKSMKGCLHNMRRVSRAIRHYASDEFSTTHQLYSELPDVVDTPEDLKGISIR